MVRTKSPTVIGGLASVRAVRRADNSGNAQEFKTRPSQNKLPKEDKEAAERKKKKTVASHAKRTAMPEKHEMLCYECGYPFVIHGIIRNVICPKCHLTLCADDITINNEWDNDIKTVANVIIKKEAIVKPCDIIARDITIAGNAKAASMQIGHILNIEKGAQLDFKKIRFKELVIKQKAKISLKNDLSCRNIEVAGTIKGNITSNGIVTIKSGGLLQGSLTATHLIVEDGGGLKAELKIGIIK
jgi:cytoskeletal protein CcmA (bactofilin family)